PLALAAGSLAQQVVEARPDPKADFNESFDPTAAVSGGVIVGTRLGEPTGKLAVGNIQLEATGETVLCVPALTRDGRFSSSNNYVFAGNPGQPASRLRLSPVTRQFGPKLSQYEAGDFAVAAFVAKDSECMSKGALHLPQLAVPGLNPRRLTIM